MKSDVVRLRITPELKEKVKAAAEKENRTVSNWIENLIRNNLKEEKRIMDKFTVNGETYELLITQDAYITGTNDNPHYEGKGIDKDGREYGITWGILEDYVPGNGEEYACDWSKPVAIEETGRTLDDMINGGESRSNPGKACYYIMIRNELDEELAYAEELVGELEDEETFARLIEDIKEQLK
ncbi:hypothetical protein DSECCO2_449620 [anaerobic digester metagenome]